MTAASAGTCRLSVAEDDGECQRQVRRLDAVRPAAPAQHDLDLGQAVARPVVDDEPADAAHLAARVAVRPELTLPHPALAAAREGHVELRLAGGVLDQHANALEVGRELADGDRNAEVAVQRDGAPLDDQLGDRPQRLLLAARHAGFALARRGAAVAARGVAVVTLLATVERAVAAARLALAGGRAAVARRRVAVVARLARVHHAVAAARLALAGGRAAVARRRVAVVARLARVHHPVAATRLALTGGRAAVARR